MRHVSRKPANFLASVVPVAVVVDTSSEWQMLVCRLQMSCGCGSKRSSCAHGCQSGMSLVAARSRTPSTSPPWMRASCSCTQRWRVTGQHLLFRHAPRYLPARSRNASQRGRLGRAYNVLVCRCLKTSQGAWWFHSTRRSRHWRVT